MNKCLSASDAEDLFLDALDKAEVLTNAQDRQKILYDCIVDIRKRTVGDENLRAEIIQLITEALEQVPFILSEMVGFERAFEDDFRLTKDAIPTSKVNGEETDEEKVDKKSRTKRTFLLNKFRGPDRGFIASSAMTYFERLALLQLMQSMIIDREHGRFIKSNEVSGNVRHLKQQLLDTIKNYLISLGKEQLRATDTTLYREDGTYNLNAFEENLALRTEMLSLLEIHNNIQAENLQKKYEVFINKLDGWEEAKAFIDAFNAKILLENFDKMTTMFIGNVVKPGALKYGQLDNDSYNTKIDKATNMWGNGFGDDLENLSDVISDVTKALVTTSKKYTWQGPAMDNVYLTFPDFMYITTKIKDLARDKNACSIKLGSQFFREAGNDIKRLSYNTRRSLDALTELRKECGLKDTTPTFGDLISFISDNPLRHIHSIFDILCNTNVTEHLKKSINKSDKDLIWSVGKEIFGTWKISGLEEDEMSRSMFDLFQNTGDSRMFEIITLAVDSMFADLFLLYYIDEEGLLKAQFLKDYAVSRVRQDMLFEMQQTHGFYDPAKFKKYIQKYNIDVDQSLKLDVSGLGDSKKKINFIKSITIPITIKIGDKEQTLKIKWENQKPVLEGNVDFKEFWKSKQFRDFIKDTIGINFNVNLELANAYELLFMNELGGYRSLISNISTICASAVFNNSFNNLVIDSALQFTGKSRTPEIITILKNAQFPEIPMTINSSTGMIPLISTSNLASYLQLLATARASVKGMLTSSLYKTGEDTSVAAQCLSCLRASFPYQILTQNKRKTSATKDSNFVNNDNGFFVGTAKMREVKAELLTKVNTDMSSVEQFTAAFLGGFVGGLCTNNTFDSKFRNGIVGFIPLVDSDKNNQEILMINLNAISNNSEKQFIKMDISELDNELRQEFGKQYDTILKNINSELLQVASILSINPVLIDKDNVTSVRNTLSALTDALATSLNIINRILEKHAKKDIARFIESQQKAGNTAEQIISNLESNKDYSEIVAKIRKSEIVTNLYNTTLDYNKTHRRNPIELAEQIHYVFDSKGRLSVNTTLLALWGRFNGDLITNQSLGITDLYPAGHEKSSTIEGFMKYEKDNRMAYELLRDGFDIYLQGKYANTSQKEIQFLKRQFPDWITNSGKMAIVKYFVPNHKYRVGDTFITQDNRIEIIGISDEDVTGLRDVLYNTIPKNARKVITIKDILPYFSQLYNGTAVVATNNKNNPIQNFGNPFETELEFIDWLIDDSKSHIYPEKRAWILQQLTSGRYKGKFIYQNLSQSKVEGASHADVLDYLINQYDWTGGVRKETMYTINEEGITHKVPQTYIDRNRANSVGYIRGKLIENDGRWVITQDVNLVKKYQDSMFTRDMLLIHPMLAKMNRLAYLSGEQYANCIGGAHYVYKGKGKDVLKEEASRWLASNKRNVCYPSTIHKFQNKTLTGIPKTYQIASIEDIEAGIYSMMGDLYTHKPIDGGMINSPWLSVLENNALAGEAVGEEKKTFGTYYYEKYAAGGIIKTASFPISNQHLRNSLAYRNLLQNMTDRTWIKEFGDADGADIKEYLDITRDYTGKPLNWIMDDSGNYTYYARKTETGMIQRFRLDKILAVYSNGTEEKTFAANEEIPAGFKPTNKYEIYEIPVNKFGETDSLAKGIRELLANNQELTSIKRTEGSDENGYFTIDSNYKMFDILFGGMNSLSLNNKGILDYSENSILQMVHAMNNIGYTRTANNNDSNFGSKKYTAKSFEKIDSQDELWQPLKYSDICYAPNIGALKSSQMNVNPKEALYTRMDLNFMVIPTAQLGVQLDKEHHADMAEVSMPTQIISACINKGYTVEYARRLYDSLSTLTELAIEDCMKGVMELMPGGTDSGKLLTEITEIIVKKLLRSQDDNEALDAIFEHLMNKVLNGLRITKEDINGKIPWSSQDLYNVVYSDIASHLTKEAVKMKFAGTLSVICPTEVLQLLYGNKRLSEFTNLTVNDFSEETNMNLYQSEVKRGKYNDMLVFDEFGRDKKKASVNDRLVLASNLDTQHHYWIEYRDSNGNPIVDNEGNVYRESVTISNPKEYQKIKKGIAYGFEGTFEWGGQTYNKEDLIVTKVYENVLKGRELGAFNVRYEEQVPEGQQARRFNILDLDSLSTLFEFENLKKDIKSLRSIENSTIIQAFGANEAIALILRTVEKKSDKLYNYIKSSVTEARPLLDLVEAIPNEKDKQDVIQIMLDAYKVICYKQMQQDFFVLSTDYKGSRQVYVNGELITVNPNTIKTQAYELIMPKVYQSKFGLEESDQPWQVLLDKDFFFKRGVERIKQLFVSDNCYHYELKNFNGLHVYIWDSKLGLPDPLLFFDTNTEFYEEEPGKFIRNNDEDEYMYTVSSKNDRIMKVGKLGYEVIVTDNPEFYLNNMEYNLATFSNQTVKEKTIADLVDKLDTNKKSARKFLRQLTTKDGKIKPFKFLKERNNSIKKLSINDVDNKSNEIRYMLLDLLKEGQELYASFSQSLDIIAGRIPAQSQQSFMPQRVVAFDNRNVNCAYVSTFLLFLQGSDLDIDCVTLLGSEFDDSGKYVTWSPYADISSIDNLKASQFLPFPTGKETDYIVDNNYVSSFARYANYIDKLFDVSKTLIQVGDESVEMIDRNERGFPKLKLKDPTPERLKLLSDFLLDVRQYDFSIKGKIDANGNWASTKEFEEEFEQYGGALKYLGFEKASEVYDAILQMKEIVDNHNTYILKVNKEAKKQMAKNQCQWAIYQVSSSPSNLTELTTGMDVSTDIIKNTKTGAVGISPYNGDDDHAAYGNQYTVFQSFLEGQVGKSCVGIGAVAIKVNSTFLIYLTEVVREGSLKLKARLKLPGNGYTFNGKNYTHFAGLYDKTSEDGEWVDVTLKDGRTVRLKTSGENALCEELLELLAEDKLSDELPVNTSVLLAAMLSVAVDNAKDLALAKINAGPAMFGLYAYGISLGMNIIELSKIINTPQGRAITKMCEGNIFNNDRGAFKAIDAINKLKGEGLRNDLTKFDIDGEMSIGVHNKNTIKGWVNVKGTDIFSASELVENLMLQYYRKFIKNKDNVKALRFIPGTTDKGQLIEPTNLSGMLFQISAAGKINDCIKEMTDFSNNELWNTFLNNVTNLKNASDFRASVYQLLEYCQRYGELCGTFFSNSPRRLDKELAILAEGGEEMRILGSILRSNKLVDAKIEDGLKFISTIENCLRNRVKTMGGNENKVEKIDFTRFCTDEQYREHCIDAYEEVKHSINILDVIATVPHFRSYIRANTIPFNAYKQASAKFRHRVNEYDFLVAKLNATRSKDKEAITKGLETCDNHQLLREFLASKRIMLTLPKNSKMFVGDGKSMIPVNDSITIPLIDPQQEIQDNGLATFKYYMESQIIPELLMNPEFARNSFIRNLIPFSLSKTPLHREVQAFTLEGGLLPKKDDRQELIVKNYKADFNRMLTKPFPGSENGGTIKNYAEAFFIYAQYVFGGKKGPRSLVSLFDDKQCGMAKDFLSFIADFDANNDFNISSDVEIYFVAPEGNRFAPNTKFYWYLNKKEAFGKSLWEADKPGQETQPNTNNGKYTWKHIDVTQGRSQESLQSLLTPNMTIAENTKRASSEVKIVFPESLRSVQNIALHEGSKDITVSVVLNENPKDLNFYDIEVTGNVTGKDESIIREIRKHLNSYCVASYRIPLGATLEEKTIAIHKEHLKALIKEVINEVEKRCK